MLSNVKRCQTVKCDRKKKKNMKNLQDTDKTLNFYEFQQRKHSIQFNAVV